MTFLGPFILLILHVFLVTGGLDCAAVNRQTTLYFGCRNKYWARPDSTVI